MNPSRRNMLGLAALAPVAGTFLASRAPADTGTKASVTAREKVRRRYFPDVVLRNQDNKKFRFYEDIVKDKIVIINFFFATCDNICPLVTSNLVKVQKMLGDRVGKDVFMSSISLKPEQDTPAQLKDFSKMHHTGPGWNFFTGDPADIEMLRQKLGFTNPDPRLDKDTDQHIGNIRYGNERLMLWATCPGMADAHFIAEAIGWVTRKD
jgi:protein SCO1/2